MKIKGEEEILVYIFKTVNLNGTHYDPELQSGVSVL